MAASTPHGTAPQRYPHLFPEVPEQLSEFPYKQTRIDDPKMVLAEEMRGKLDHGPIKLRMKTYAARAKDFERDDQGNPLFHSLPGPDKLAARTQFVRERFVALAEVNLLRQELSECFRQEKADAREHCKHLIKAYTETISRPYWNMEKVRPRSTLVSCAVRMCFYCPRAF